MSNYVIMLLSRGRLCAVISSNYLMTMECEERSKHRGSTDKDTDRETDRETEKQRERERESERDVYKERKLDNDDMSPESIRTGKQLHLLFIALSCFVLLGICFKYLLHLYLEIVLF
mgnify:CR=1 FL=1